MTPEQLGPYRIVRTLGRGGMGAVYEGINVETDEPAAVKILVATLAEEPDFRQRFEVEIETLRKLYHPNIVQLFGFGEQEGHLFYAMELVEGSSLEEELRRGRWFDWREVARIGIQTCRALRHAHDRGIIHRDIKPANLLLSKEGHVKLSDFGIARLFGNTRITSAGNVLGTAEYMAPEQADGRPVGPRTDLYSLGGLLYCLLARRPPFRAKSLMEMLDQHRSAKPEPVSCVASDVPAELDHIILQLLEKDPEKRITNATLVARRLGAMLHALSVEPSREEQQALDELARQAETPAEPGTEAVGDLPLTRIAGDSWQRPGAPTQVTGREGKVPLGKTATHLLGDPKSPSPTRTAHAGASPKAAAGETPSPIQPKGLAGAKPTADFEDPAGAAQETPAEPQPPGAERPANRFVAVGQEELDRPDEDESPWALISLHTWVLAAALLAVGLTIWYFLRPPSADALYGRISETTADQTIESLLNAKPSIDEFIISYSDDPRASQLREYLREIELHNLERQFDKRAKNLTKAEKLLPIERAYLEAINNAAIDPERGLAKLHALVELYQDRTDLSGPAGKCLELARRRFKALQQQLDRDAPDALAELESRLQRAEMLHETQPETARAIWQGLIDLYQDKPWAAEAVAQARCALEAAGGKPKP